MSVLEGAVRSGRHVFLAVHAGRRVVTVGDAREERSFVRSSEDIAVLHRRLPVVVDESAAAREGGGAGVPVFVDAVRIREPRSDHRRGALIYAAPDGATLEEIAVRTELQGARLDAATALTILARGVRAAGAPRTREGPPLPPPQFAASTLRVAWNGSVTFLGHLPNEVVPWLGRAHRRRGSATWFAARALLVRFGGDLDEVQAVVDAMSGVGEASDVTLSVDAAPWRRVAGLVDGALERIGGAVDDARLAGLVRALFPDHHARHAVVMEEIALLGDDDLRAVPDHDGGAR